MSRFTPEELAKLPKWAQGQIEALEGDMESMRRKLVAVETLETNVWLDSYPDTIPLPPNSRVIFDLNGSKIWVGVREGYDGRDRLLLHERGGGSRWLMAESGVSNTMTILNLDLRRLEEK